MLVYPITISQPRNIDSIYKDKSEWLSLWKPFTDSRNNLSDLFIIQESWGRYRLVTIKTSTAAPGGYEVAHGSLSQVIKDIAILTKAFKAFKTETMHPMLPIRLSTCAVIYLTSVKSFNYPENYHTWRKKIYDARTCDISNLKQGDVIYRKEPGLSGKLLIKKGGAWHDAVALHFCTASKKHRNIHAIYIGNGKSACLWHEYMLGDLKYDRIIISDNILDLVKNHPDYKSEIRHIAWPWHFNSKTTIDIIDKLRKTYRTYFAARSLSSPRQRMHPPFSHAETFAAFCKTGVYIDEKNDKICLYNKMRVKMHVENLHDRLFPSMFFFNKSDRSDLPYSITGRIAELIKGHIDDLFDSLLYRSRDPLFIDLDQPPTSSSGPVGRRTWEVKPIRPSLSVSVTKRDPLPSSTVKDKTPTPCVTAESKPMVGDAICSARRAPEIPTTGRRRSPRFLTRKSGGKRPRRSNNNMPRRIRRKTKEDIKLRLLGRKFDQFIHHIALQITTVKTKQPLVLATLLSLFIEPKFLHTIWAILEESTLASLAPSIAYLAKDLRKISPISADTWRPCIETWLNTPIDIFESDFRDDDATSSTKRASKKVASPPRRKTKEDIELRMLGRKFDQFIHHIALQVTTVKTKQPLVLATLLSLFIEPKFLHTIWAILEESTLESLAPPIACLAKALRKISPISADPWRPSIETWLTTPIDILESDPEDTDDSSAYDARRSGMLLG